MSDLIGDIFVLGRILFHNLTCEHLWLFSGLDILIKQSSLYHEMEQWQDNLIQKFVTQHYLDLRMWQNFTFVKCIQGLNWQIFGILVVIHSNDSPRLSPFTCKFCQAVGDDIFNDQFSVMLWLRGHWENTTLITTRKSNFSFKMWINNFILNEKPSNV